MSEGHPPRPLSITRRLLWLAGLLCKSVLIFFLLLLLLQIFAGFEEVGFHLLTGWFFFLRDHLAHMSTNAATWVPGVIAFIASIAVGHLLLRGWAKRKNRKWSPAVTVTLALIVPILFVVSFLVPGLILQVRELSKERWHNRGASIARSDLRQEIQRLQFLLFEATVSSEGTGERFPDDLSGLDEINSENVRNRRVLSSDRDRPLEFPIYLGAGFTADSDPQLPLLISPRFLEREGFSRWVATIGGKIIQIPDEETDAWIQRSLDARAPKAR